LLLLVAALPARAADVGRAHQVISMIYDISLYNSELDRIMDQADTRGVYGGAGSTAFSRAHDKSLTHATMMSQRDAVLSLATQKLAGRATDQQLSALIDLAGGTQPANQSQIDAAVSNVKASFEEALWDQLARSARGNTMFPCTKDQRSRC
jgi:hypothetical protein